MSLWNHKWISCLLKLCCIIVLGAQKNWRFLQMGQVLVDNAVDRRIWRGKRQQHLAAKFKSWFKCPASATALRSGWDHEMWNSNRQDWSCLEVESKSIDFNFLEETKRPNIFSDKLITWKKKFKTRLVQNKLNIIFFMSRTDLPPWLKMEQEIRKIREEYSDKIVRKNILTKIHFLQF